MKRYLIIGASRGIGAAVAKHLASQGHEIISVSRTPGSGEWIEADISTSAGIEKVSAGLAGRTIDGLLFLGGVWENGAFTSSYDFIGSPLPLWAGLCQAFTHHLALKGSTTES
jgi:3-oxoacyl-[acyl-carrier protein] reductase